MLFIQNKKNECHNPSYELSKWFRFGKRIYEFKTLDLRKEKIVLIQINNFKQYGIHIQLFFLIGIVPPNYDNNTLLTLDTIDILCLVYSNLCTKIIFFKSVRIVTDFKYYYICAEISIK